MKVKKRSTSLIRILEAGAILGLAAFLLLGMSAERTQSGLSEKVVRLHVLANSDSEADQNLKLRVRDRVLDYAAPLLETAADRREAEGLLRGSLLEIERVAAEEIAAAGYSYPVTAELKRTAFATKEYDGFSLPAGEYLALRVVIGEGAGQNWWCVVFPPLCTAAAADVSQEAMAAGLSGEEVRLITGEEGYVLKFKTIELLETWKQKIT